jgi:hypothetical protein
MKSCHFINFPIASRSIHSEFISFVQMVKTLKGLRPLLQSPAPVKFIIGFCTHLWVFIHPHQRDCLTPGQRDYNPLYGICCHSSLAHMTEAPSHTFKVSVLLISTHLCLLLHDALRLELFIFILLPLKLPCLI